MENAEIAALDKVYEALKELNDDDKRWVLEAIGRKFFGSNQITASTHVPVVNGAGITAFDSVADVFAKASPETESEKVLVVAAFLQEREGRPELASREIHSDLKHLGHIISNITVAINYLISAKPSLMIQTRKQGKTKQATKKFRVTVEGVKRVSDMINMV